MPHLHLGLLARRKADYSVASQQLARAYELLADEDDRRIALFGGGFGRQALLSLCKAEWNRAEESR